MELDALAAELSGDASAPGTSTFDSAPPGSSSRDQAAAFANGDPVADPVVGVLRQQRFDVILSLPLLKVWTRAGSRARGQWFRSNVRLREDRLSLFAYMLMHPGEVVGTHNADDIYRGDAVSANALAQTMRRFRSLLHQRNPTGPYLINTKVLVSAGHRRGYVVHGYMMNANRNYLVICKKF
jgi:hypothetical protein